MVLGNIILAGIVDLSMGFTVQFSETSNFTRFEKLVPSVKRVFLVIPKSYSRGKVFLVYTIHKVL